MATTDQERWDRRYAQRDHAAQRPSAYLVAMLASLPEPAAGAVAADLACGRGRNARHLATAGYRVHGYDVSPVGLAAAAEATPAELAGAIEWRHRDLLEAGLPDTARYDFVLLSRFVAPALCAEIQHHVVPGGYVCIEEHLAVPEDAGAWRDLVNAADWPDPNLEPAALTGPGSARFRVAPGTLEQALADAAFEVVDSFEGLVSDAEGQPALLARLLARRVGG